MSKIREIEVVRSVCLESFFYFCVYFWSTVVKEKPVWNWHIPYLCDEIQTAAERVIAKKPKLYDLIINQPPGTTKSTIISILLPAWLFARDPELRSICGSHTFDLTMNLSRKSRDVLQMKSRPDGKFSYGEVFPEIVLREDQNTKDHFENTLGGFRKSVTVGGKSPMGFHAHFLIVDDPLDPQQAASEADVKAANEWMTETLPSRKVDEQTTLTILVMQRLHQNDPTGNWLSRSTDMVRRISLPADLNEFPVFPEHLSEKYVDGLLDAKRLPRHTLKTKRLLLGEWAYAGQYGQSPIPRTGGMFKFERLKPISKIPNDIFEVVRYWDKAGTHMGGCFTAGVLMGISTNFFTKLPEFYILDVVAGQWAAEERERTIVQTAQIDYAAWRDKLIIGVEEEGGSGGIESASATVRRLAGFRVIRDKVKGEKALRADPFATQVNDGNVSFLLGPWNPEYMNEIQFFPASTYKDRTDASSGAFAILNRKRIEIGALW